MGRKTARNMQNRYTNKTGTQCIFWFYSQGICHDARSYSLKILCRKVPDKFVNNVSYFYVLIFVRLYFVKIVEYLMLCITETSYSRIEKKSVFFNVLYWKRTVLNFIKIFLVFPNMRHLFLYSQILCCSMYCLFCVVLCIVCV